MSGPSASASGGALARWCERHLGSLPRDSFLTAPRTSTSWGFGLADGRLVALRVGPPSARLAACTAAQRRAFEAGIGCPAPLAGPEPLDDDTVARGDPPLVVTAESLRTDGSPWPSDDPPGCYGRLLGRLVAALAEVDPTPLAPPPAWLRYDHRAAGRLWAPITEDADDPEAAIHLLPARLTSAATAARRRLLAVDLPVVAGHAGLSGAHVRWREGTLGTPHAVVHRWDLLAARPEAVLVGCLTANYYGLPDQPRLAPVVQGERVLAAYQAERGRGFSTDEVQVAWAASAWVACHAAALEHVRGAAGQVTHQLLVDAPLRLHLAGC